MAPETVNIVNDADIEEDEVPSLVELRPVTRDDVKRIAVWLDDTEVADAWFGRYTYGDAAHLGYEPKIMIDADDDAWDEVFHDPHHEPHRDIFSIYTLSGEHIGEGQLSIDEALGDAFAEQVGRHVMRTGRDEQDAARRHQARREARHLSIGAAPRADILARFNEGGRVGDDNIVMPRSSATARAGVSMPSRTTSALAFKSER